MATREQYSGRLVCLRCGETGDADWEENASPGPRGLERHLIALPQGFRAKKGDDSDDPKIVGKKCKKIVC